MTAHLARASDLSGQAQNSERTPVAAGLQAPIRPELPPMPLRMRALPIDGRGYPVPFFVAWIDGKPDHRVADTGRIARAIRGKLCHLCGQPLARLNTFVLGPMCGINRVSGEPPDHPECARWAAKACPFLTRPHAKRRGGNLPTDSAMSDNGLRRNPGVTLLWTTERFRILKDPGGRGWLWELGEPTALEFLAEGRSATHAEVVESIQSGLPLLEEPARAEGMRAVWALQAMTLEFMGLVDAQVGGQ